MVQVLKKMKGNRIVAVVGVAHLDGISKEWNKTQQQQKQSTKSKY